MLPPIRFTTITVAMLGISMVVMVDSSHGQTTTRSGMGQGLLRQGREKKKDVVGLSLAATGEQVVDLRIEGNRTISTSQILNQLQTRTGRPFDPKIVQRDVRKLASLSWFVDVKPLYEKTPEGRVVIFKVVERPTIRYVEMLGNRRIRDKTLLKEINLKVGGSVDPFAVEDGRRRMLDLYKRNGFNETQITVLEGSKATDQGVVYIVNEGISQRIWKVKFVGANFVPARRLKTRIKSKPPTALMIKGFVDRDQIDADVQTITDFYRAFGFYQAKVGRQIEFNEAGTWATLKFVIHEGPRYQIRNVRFMGNTLISDSSLTTGLRMPPGLPYERSKMNDDINWLKELYGSQGFVFADIRAEQVLLEEPGQLDLVYHIEEGKRWRVGRIIVNINGDNTHSRIQTALNRLSIEPGEVIDIREVRASERRLQASGLFLTDAVQGIAPRITFQIPELESVEVASKGNFRGQSPDPKPIRRLPNVKSTPGTSYVHEVQRPTQYSDDELVDIYLDINSGKVKQAAPASHGLPAAAVEMKPAPQKVRQATDPDRPIIRGQSPNSQDYYGRWRAPNRTATQSQPIRQQPAAAGNVYQAYQPAVGVTATPANGQLAQSRSVQNPYGQLVVRSQSPYQPAAQPPATQNYGGRLPAATSPQAAPIGHSNAQPIQQVQFTETIPPPTTVAPPPVTGQGPFPQGPPLPQGPITPIPAQPGIAPAVPFPGLNPYTDPAVDVIVDVAEAPTGRFQIGAGINSDAGVVGTISLDERNFDWRRPPTSWNDFVEGRAWRGAGQRFRLEAAPGTEVQRYLVSFGEPYLLDSPLSLGLSGSYFERRFSDWDEQRTGGRVSLGWQWVEHDLSASLGYRGELVNINDVPGIVLDNVPEIRAMNGDNTLHGFRFGIINDTRDSAFFPTEGHLIDLSFEQVVGTFEYPRAIIDIREYALLRERPDHSGRHVLSAGTRLGFSGRDTPVYDNFFAGGFSTLRGFDFRGASPVSPFPGGFAEVGGEFMWISTLEYLFPLTADDMIHGVAFVDFGTVEENVTIKPENFRVAPGVGLRLTIPAMGPAPIALDFAWGVERAPTDDLQVFSFNVGFTR